MASVSIRSGSSSGGIFEQAGRVANDRLHLANALHRAATGQRGDAPRAGRHALLAGDLENADQRAVVQMGAAAKLFAELADRDHADHVAILLAEEHRRPGCAGFGQRHLDVADRLAGQNLRVHLILDANQILFAHRRGVGKVEPQPIVIDLRALLQGVRAKDFLQGVMQQMRGRVRPADALATPDIDLGNGLGPARSDPRGDGRDGA